MPHIAVLPGDGIGPEVTRVAVHVLEAAGAAFGADLRFSTHPVGGVALDEFDTPLPEATRLACKRADAILMGAIGDPKWDHETGERRCEAALLGLRKMLGAYANLRPVLVPEALAANSPLRTSRVADTDILIVRELTGGIYFAEPRSRTEEYAVNTMTYTREEIARIARVAFRWAEKRNGRVTSVDKANVLEVSQLWRNVVTDVHAQEFAQLELEHLYVDNAAMQLVLRPRQFDVLLTANLFGDILSDLAATLPGSLGVLPSASVGGAVDLFEPVHGSAPDIAGYGIANPVAAILSAAMLLDSLEMGEAADRVRNGVTRAMTAGLRTQDLGGHSSTVEFGDAVVEYAFEDMLTPA